MTRAVSTVALAALCGCVNLDGVTQIQGGSGIDVEKGADNNYRVGLADGAIGRVSGSAGYLPVFSDGNSVASSGVFQAGTSGSIGIGTTTPDRVLDWSGSPGLHLSVSDPQYSFLHVVGGTAARLSLVATSAPKDERWMMMSSQGGYTKFTAVSDNGISLGDALTIEHATGNIGVGTAAPGVLPGNIPIDGTVLSVSSPSNRAVLSLVGTYSDLWLMDTDANPDTKLMLLRSADGATGFITHSDAGHARLYPLTMKHASGNVGIGTPDPQSSLQVVGDYLQIPASASAGPPPAADCNKQTHQGRMIIMANTLYICPGSGTGWIAK